PPDQADTLFIPLPAYNSYYSRNAMSESFAHRKNPHAIGSMMLYLHSVVVFSGISLAVFATRAKSASDPLVETTQKIATEITANGKAYADLRELTNIGPRLSGSDGAANAVEWAKRKMESYAFDRVVLQPAMVPRWTRGDIEQATVTSTPHPI